MEKKWQFLIIIILIVLIAIGIMTFNQFNSNEHQIKIGNTTFNLPEGFHQGTPNNDVFNITNGYDTLFLKECGKDNITKYIDEYKNYKHNENNTTQIVIHNFTVNNIIVYKSTVVNDSSSIHYWFDNGNLTYSIYTWSGNQNSDKIVKDIIGSIT